MKRYGIVHNVSGIEVGSSDDLRNAVALKQSLGPDFSTITWVGFGGLPAAACVMRDDGQLETICLYIAEAENIVRIKNEMQQDGHSYKVVQVIINTHYPHAHGQYSV